MVTRDCAIIFYCDECGNIYSDREDAEKCEKKCKEVEKQ